ncbi:MAG: hypothetical protein JWN02_361, partial [Acidobacteria bacterium]|nr:hypothetical protein [Acidobacteriota bacterium]
LACTTLAINGNTHTFDGSTFYDLSEIDIVFKPGGWSQAQFDVIATHELGHGLGLRHSDAGTPFSNSAIMASTTSTTFGTTLQQWDKDAIDTLYGSGPPCTAPTINSTSGGGSVASGQSATLTVSASGGVAPLSYQWYDGTSGNTSTPVGSNNASYTTPPITSAKNYWVRVSSGCGMSSDSTTIAVTVAACTAPSVSGTTGGGNVTSGQSTTLTVAASGSASLNYQWYDGPSGNPSTPVGANNPSFTTPPITAAKSYWVKVSNSCGSANSNTITVTPVACALPNILSDPASQTVNSGAAVTLSVALGGAGPFSYQWYQGAKGTTTTPVGTGATFTTPPITQTASYWVRVSNGCGSSDSNAAILSLAGSCTSPSISFQPLANLLVFPPRPIALVAGGSGDGPLSYQWYKGNPPDTSTKVNGLAPSDSRWVQMAYVELLGRVASAPEIGVFTTLISSQGGSRLGATQAILASTEYRLVTIRGLYTKLLGRSPSAAEETFWLGAITNGLTEEGLAAAILGSPEFFAVNGGTVPTWKARAAQFIFGAPSAAQLSAFDALIAGGGSRTSIAKALLAGSDARSFRITSWFTAFLRRTATTAEINSMLSLLAASGGDYNKVLAVIVSSNEYASFPTALILDQVADPANYWVQVSNPCGSANSTVSAITTTAACVIPVILSGPSSISGGLGTFIFGVSAAGNVPLTYQWYEGPSGDTSHPLAGETSASLSIVKGTPGTYSYWVRVSNECGGVSSPSATATVACIIPQPVLTAPGQVKPGETFRISWTAVPGATSYLVTPVNATIVSCSATPTEACLQPAIPGPGNITVTVKAVACATGPDSTPASIYVNPAPPTNSPNFDFASLTRTPITQTIFIGGNPVTAKTALDTNDAFVITSDRPWLTVSPTTGPLPPEGTTVVATLDPAQLANGTSGATLTIIKFTQGQGKTISTTSTTTTGVSFSLVSPVSPTPKSNNSPADTLLIPAVAHADGIGSHFQSDIRIANLAATTANYLLSFTPSSTDGTQKGLQTSISVNAGQTLALDNIVKNWFGAGVAGVPGIGTLEIRPASTSSSGGGSGTGTTSPRVGTTTVASSRTYNVADTGTFGQFIPAIPLLNFLSKSDTARLSLQQVAQSASYRTNVGLVEGSGQKVDLTLRLLKSDGTSIGEVPFSLRPFEHTQFNLAAVFPGVNLTDGRLEVKVVSDGGSVSAYASVLDNKTTDPLLVFPVQPTLVSAKRYVVPGVAELNNGAANFHTDLRIFNGSTSPVDVTVAYSTTDRTPPTPVQMTINAGEVKNVDNTLQTLWGISGSGGAVVVTTDSNSSLVLTARTFSRRDDGGTFGQFIPGLSEKEGAGSGDRPLQVLQLEQSPGFRSNLGLAELSGKPVSVKLRATVPDSLVSASVDVNLGPNEFRQLSSIFSSMGYGTIYNGRISVEVTGGDGRVGAYGSVIDNRTQDPTYVPAQ